MSEHVLTSGQTGGTIKGNDHALMNHTLANTPNSTSNRSTAENSPKRKSRPPSNVGTSPRSSIDGRIHRIQSLDERVSSLSGSRNHSDASGNDYFGFYESINNIIFQTHHLIMQIFSLMNLWRFTHHILRLVYIIVPDLIFYRADSEKCEPISWFCAAKFVGQIWVPRCRTVNARVATRIDSIIATQFNLSWGWIYSYWS